MRIEESTYLDFDDVLIRPKYSDLNSREEVILEREFLFPHSSRKIKVVPICSANMATTGTFSMARSLSKFSALTALHKHYSAEEYYRFFCEMGMEDRVFYCIGTSDEDLSKMKKLYEDHVNFSRLIMIDVANGYRKDFVDFVKKTRDIYGEDIVLAVGNVATEEMVQKLIIAGADIVKIGIGPGAVCRTRTVAGVGVPQLSAIINCADAAHGLGGFIMADGGITCPADVAKAFGAGADFVMIGSYLAGTDECEGEWISAGKGEDRYLKHFGMSSKEAMEKYGGEVKNYRASEGLSLLIQEKGPVENVMQEILGGLRSACTYTSSSKLKDLSKCTTFLRVNNTYNKDLSGDKNV
jgi:GMP reductase